MEAFAAVRNFSRLTEFCLANEFEAQAVIEIALRNRKVLRAYVAPSAALVPWAA